MLSLAVQAQKKEIGEARSYVKSGSNLDKAEQLMTNLLTNPENRKNRKIYEVWYEAVEKQYEAANEKLYLHQPYDTAAFYALVRHFFEVGEALDSVDALPDKKGRVRPDFRHHHAEQLNMLRPNIYYGGTYHTRRNDYGQAFKFFDTYIDTDRQPLFAGYDYRQKDPLMSQAAYWATYCGYKAQSAEQTLRYSELALTDADKRDYTLQYVCEAYRWQQQDSAYVARLRQGVDEFPEHPYFFPRLADWYTAHSMVDSVLAIADRGLRQSPDNQLMLLAKSVAQLNLNQDNSCIVTSKRLIALNDTLPEPYYNIAMVYLNKALALEELNEPRKNRARLKELYQLALPYMENYRRLAPDDRQRWAPGLYRIYLNLNKGPQFEEIDRLLRTMNN